MKTACPNCGQHFEIEQEHIGSIAQCTSCGKDFVIQILQEQQAPIVLQPAVQNEYVQSPAPQPAPVSTEQPASHMKALTCEMCGSTNLIKQEGVFVCQSCGTKYSVEEAKKIMFSGTVNVAGTVKVDISEKLNNLYTIARRAKDDNNGENAAKYYDLILQEDPESWEASFYLVYYKAMSCKRIMDIPSAANSVESCLKNVVELILRHVSAKTERENIFKEITLRVVNISSLFGSGATSRFKEFVVITREVKEGYEDMGEDLGDQEIREMDENARDYIYNMKSFAQICYTWGDLIDPLIKKKDLSCTSWKTAIDLHKMCISYCADEESNKAVLEKYASKIRKTEPDYTLPTIPPSDYTSLLTRPNIFRSLFGLK